ncbi:MAG TPA: SdpI family protein [Candidatus Merdenecus merdavium]|nr:SdpI family protein [Candidatus Merdenecus merdavium]
MKDKKEVLFNILMFLPMLVVLISLFYLPKDIPAHYGEGFAVDRWGSKYETLIYGVIPIAFGGIMRIISQTETKQSNKKAKVYGGIIGLAVFNIIILGFIYNAFRLTSLSEQLIIINLSKIFLVTLGISLVVTGNIVSKAKRNKLTGIRYSGTITDEKTWNIRQRIGGSIMMLVGIIIVIINLIFKSNNLVIFITLILLIAVIPATILVNRIALKKL